MTDMPALQPGEEGGDTLFTLLQRRAARSPAKGVYVRDRRGGQEFRTFSQLLAAAERVACGCKQRGVEPGDRVLVAQRTGVDFIATFFGLQALGAVPIPLGWPQQGDPFSGIENLARWRRMAIRYDARMLICEDSGDRAEQGFSGIWPPHPLEVVTEMSQLLEGVPSRVDVHPHPVSPDDVAYIQATSGTTGPPRGVKLTHRGICTSVEAIGDQIEVQQDDVLVSWLPLDNIMGLVGVVFFALHWGIRPVLMDPSVFLESPEEWFWAISEHRATLSLAPNFAFNYCVRRCNASELEGLDLSSWRIAMNGSEPVRAQHIQAFARRFHDYGLGDHVIMPVYGLSEATLGVTFHPAKTPIRIDGINRRQLEQQGRAAPLPPDGADTQRERMHVVSVGRPLDGIELRIVDEQGAPLGERELGEIAIRGPNVMAGYVEATVRDEQASPTRLDGDWLLTGDLGYLAEGELYFVTRASDRIVLESGRTIFPEEVELFVDAVDGVRAGSTAVFAQEDRAGADTQIVVVFEVQTGADARELSSIIESVLQAHLDLKPDRLVDLPVRSVPKTPTGKVRRHHCRRLLAEGLLGTGGLGMLQPAFWQKRADAVAETLRGGGESMAQRVQRLLQLD